MIVKTLIRLSLVALFLVGLGLTGCSEDSNRIVTSGIDTQGNQLATDLSESDGEIEVIESQEIFDPPVLGDDEEDIVIESSWDRDKSDDEDHDTPISDKDVQQRESDR